MHGLLAPVMAQLVTLALGDRIEGQYLISDEQRTFESSNASTAGATLTLDWGRAALTFGYSPTLTIVPLEETPRDVLLFHNAVIGGQYRWRGTTLGLTQSASYGERDLAREALGAQPDPQGANPPGGAVDPTPPATGAPGGPTPGGGAAAAPAPTAPTTPTTPTALPLTDDVRYGSFRSAASLDHTVSRALSLHFAGGYSISGGTDRESRRVIPIVRGPDASASGDYALDGRNTFTTKLTAQFAYSQNGTDAFVTTLTEDYIHRFSRHTQGNLGAGVAFSRNKPPGGLALYSIYPTGQAGLSHTGRKAGGTYALALTGSTAPVLEPTTATVDPRLATIATANFTRRRLSLTATGSTALSLTPGERTALSSVSTSLVASYNLGAGFAVDTGMRSVWQRYGDRTLVKPTTVLFAGVSWNAVVPIHTPRP
jgi:hypothetical protein